MCSIACCASRKRLGDHHAFAGGQPVSLDDDRRAARLDIGASRRAIGEALVGGGRDAMALHERLWQNPSSSRAGLPRGSARRCAGRARGTGRRCRPPAALPVRPRSASTFSAAAKSASSAKSVNGTLCSRSSSAVPPLPGATNTVCHTRRLQQLPRDRVFAAAAADHQHLHKSSSALWWTSCASSRSSSDIEQLLHALRIVAAEFDRVFGAHRHFGDFRHQRRHARTPAARPRSRPARKAPRPHRRRRSAHRRRRPRGRLPSPCLRWFRARTGTARNA